MKDTNFEERFNKKWPSVSIGYDGSAADAYKRHDMKKFILQERISAKEETVREINDYCLAEGYESWGVKSYANLKGINLTKEK